MGVAMNWHVGGDDAYYEAEHAPECHECGSHLDKFGECHTCMLDEYLQEEAA